MKFRESYFSDAKIYMLSLLIALLKKRRANCKDSAPFLIRTL